MDDQFYFGLIIGAILCLILNIISILHRQSKREIYRHFKGNTYQYLFEAQHTENGEKLYIYTPYPGDHTGIKHYWARPKDSFVGKVKVVSDNSESEIPRFQKVRK